MDYKITLEKHGNINVLRDDLINGTKTIFMEYLTKGVK